MQHVKQGDVHGKQAAGVCAQPVSQFSDEYLLTAIASGGIWAMDALYQRYSRVLYALAYRIVAHQQAAEDLVQEAFLAIWRHAATYAPQTGAARSWLCAIVHHRAIDYLRAVRRRSVLLEVTRREAEQAERSAIPDMWEEVWLSLQGMQVREALTQLTKGQRQMIELVYFQGWTQAEVARGYQIPLGTVKARIRRGLIHLKCLLTEKEVDER